MKPYPLHPPQAPAARRPLAAVLLAALLVLVWGLWWWVRAPADTAAAQAQRLAYDLGHVQRDSAPGPDGLRQAWMPVRSVKPAVGGLLHFAELRPAGTPSADVLFLHGHADRLDNHRALFKAWQQGGARVIALDWPSHGQTRIGPLDIYEADDLIALVRLVERATLEDPQRPLVLAAWSYGGLIATRLLQQPPALQSLSRRPAGLWLLAPGVAVQPFVGGDGIARVETLMHAPYATLAGPPSPASPLLNPVFALRTLALAWTAQQALLPRDIPVQVIVGDERNDWYVETRGIVDWARRQQAAGVPLQLLQCAGARHALDNEPWPLGQRVRELGVAFVGHAQAARPQGALAGGAAPARTSATAKARAPEMAATTAMPTPETACQLLSAESPTQGTTP